MHNNNKDRMLIQTPQGSPYPAAFTGQQWSVSGECCGELWCRYTESDLCILLTSMVGTSLSCERSGANTISKANLWTASLRLHICSFTSSRTDGVSPGRKWKKNPIKSYQINIEQHLDKWNLTEYINGKQTLSSANTSHLILNHRHTAIVPF